MQKKYKKNYRGTELAREWDDLQRPEGEVGILLPLEMNKRVKSLSLSLSLMWNVIKLQHVEREREK